MEELEIEKRYLVVGEKIKEIKSFIIPDSEITMNDIYIPNGKLHKDLRLRQKGDKYMITRKRPIQNGDATSMLETTIDLSKEEFDALSEGIRTNVRKKRYLVDYLNRKGELDLFEGRHEGLVILEFEFRDGNDLKDFNENNKIDLLDITNIEWLAGGRLAEIDEPTTLFQKVNTLTDT